MLGSAVQHRAARSPISDPLPIMEPHKRDGSMEATLDVTSEGSNSGSDISEDVISYNEVPGVQAMSALQEHRRLEKCRFRESLGSHLGHKNS